MSANHTLTFSKLRASFTVDKELIGKQDPYVIFTSGNSKAQTKAIRGVGTGTAEWKETYSLEKFSPSSSSVVEVTVYNHNTLLPDNVIGSGTVDLSNQGESSLSGSGEPVSVILTDKKAQEVGTISFLVNGGGYTGRGRTGAGVTGATGAGIAGAAGAAGSGARTGTTGQHGTGTGSTSGQYGSGTTGSVVGQGIGTDRTTAQKASDAAAISGKTVAIEEKNALGVGHPTTRGSGTTTGTNTGAGYGTTGTTTGTGATSGTGITGSGTRSSATGVVASGAQAGDRTVYGEREGDIIDRKYYVGTESRPQDQALVEQYREHNPYAKDYETTVQHTGRERLINSQIEALGTRERLIGQDHHVHAHPAEQIARNLPAGALAERPGGEGWIQTKPGPICDTNTFSITGDRTVTKERVTDLREHREFEKEFEVKTRLVGERALARGAEAEILNRERVLVDEKNKIACEGHPTASATGGATIASQAGGASGYNTTGYTAAGTGTTGTGYNTGTTGTTGTGYNTGSTGTGTGYNTGTTGTTGTGYNTGTTGTGSGYNTGTTGTTGTGYNTGTTGTGTGYNTGTTGTTGTGYNTGTTGTGTGYNTGTTGTGSGYNTGTTGTGTGYNTGTGARGTTGQTTGEKVASYIPGSEENRASKGNVNSSTVGQPTAGEKAASFIPGTQENREKKAANQPQYA